MYAIFVVCIANKIKYSGKLLVGKLQFGQLSSAPNWENDENADNMT